jgi:hypothetical protein
MEPIELNRCTLESHLSRVDRFLPIRQVDVCFLRLPPGFPAVPQYFNHVFVGPASHITIYLYHNYCRNDINDYALKSCIFAESAGLWTTGRQPDSIRR